ARAAAHAGRHRLAGGRLLPVPLLRRRQAAADPALRPHPEGRLRRDVRRHPRGVLRAARPCGRAPALAGGVPVVTKDGETLATLAARVAAALKDRGAVLATAESCTGGWVA